MYTEVEFMSHAVEYRSQRNRRCMCQRSGSRNFALRRRRGSSLRAEKVGRSDCGRLSIVAWNNYSVESGILGCNGADCR